MKDARKILCVCCVLAFGAASGFAGSGSATKPAGSALPAAPASGQSSPSARQDVSRLGAIPETDYGIWIAPGPDEPAILAGVGDGFGKTALHYSSIALVAGGTGLCAAGVAMAFNGISGGLDSAAIHRGALCFISGSLTAALFSAVMDATSKGRTTSKERSSEKKTTSPE